MGVYIPNMQVPKTCGKCLLVGWHYVFDCRLDECDTRMQSCPLVEVPPHGRLIDRDALTLFGQIVTRDAPTIIPAELCKEKGE